MRIAFISYEYPPDTAGGGIGTYLYHSVQGLKTKGHTVFVFCGSSGSEPYTEDETIVRIPARNWYDFDEQSVSYFERYHSLTEFDLIEGTDFRGNGLSIKRKFPSLPYIVRLHTPNFLIDKLNYVSPTFTQRLRFMAGSLRKFRWPSPKGSPTLESYPKEIENLRAADYLLAPSNAIVERLSHYGLIENSKTFIVPFFFVSRPEFLTMEPRKRDSQGIINVLFVGRHEVRKGIEDIFNAMPRVLKSFRTVHFYFVGRSAASPVKGTDMVSYLMKKFKRYSAYFTFIGEVRADQVSRYYEQADICVFPSYWESFGLVCFEAMAAAKAIIASKEGAMPEILTNEEAILVQPNKPGEIADAILRYASDAELRINHGREARKKLKSQYLFDVIGNRTEEFYCRVAKKRNTSLS